MSAHANHQIVSAFGLNFIAEPQKTILEKIVGFSKSSDKAKSVTFTNAHVIVESHWNKGFKAQLEQATLIVPDGVPVAWVLKNLQPSKSELIDRYSGPDLMMDTLKKAADKKHVFLGSSPTVLEAIRKRLETEYNISNATFYSPPFEQVFSEEEKVKQINIVNDAQADFIWVGLGAPKQEKYVIEMSQRPGARGTWLAVGAAFDFFAGSKKRAPKFVQDVGLEWAFRMFSEPKRLASRYLKTNPIFIKLALKEILKSSS
jgi:exopolysaccharide biosynthesis WecB/TagA/CpsF family protein